MVDIWLILTISIYLDDEGDEVGKDGDTVHTVKETWEVIPYFSYWVAGWVLH